MSNDVWPQKSNCNILQEKYEKEHTLNFADKKQCTLGFLYQFLPCALQKRLLQYNEIYKMPRKSILYFLKELDGISTEAKKANLSFHRICYRHKFGNISHPSCFFQLGNFFHQEQQSWPQGKPTNKKEDKLHFWRKMGNTSRKDTAVVARFYVQINSSSNRTQRQLCVLTSAQ